MKQYAAVALVLALASCGVDSDFSKDTSQALFTDANGQVHALHVEALALENWPQEFSFECADGGYIAMVTTERDDGSILRLEHTLSDCVVQGRTLTGQLDYEDISTPDCNGTSGFAFTIVGELTVAGPEAGVCQMRAVESCGKITGTTCGYDI